MNGDTEKIYPDPASALDYVLFEGMICGGKFAVANLGILDVVAGGLKIVERAEGVSKTELRAATEATLA